MHSASRPDDDPAQIQESLTGLFCESRQRSFGAGGITLAAVAADSVTQGVFIADIMEEARAKSPIASEE